MLSFMRAPKPSPDKAWMFQQEIKAWLDCFVAEAKPDETELRLFAATPCSPALLAVLEHLASIGHGATRAIILMPGQGDETAYERIARLLRSDNPESRLLLLPKGKARRARECITLSERHIWIGEGLSDARSGLHSVGLFSNDDRDSVLMASVAFDLMSRHAREWRPGRSRTESGHADWRRVFGWDAASEPAFR